MGSKYPIDIELNSGFSEHDIRLHDILVREGYETEETIQKLQSGVPMSGKRKEVDWKRYSPTEKGKALLFQKKSIIGKDTVMCFGEVSNLTVENFTKPGGGLPGSAVTVLFKYQLKNLPKWLMENKEVIGRHTSNKLTTDSQSDNIGLVLTDNGWVTADQLQRIPLSFDPL
ncbi:hypothetical protein OAO01_09295 [Oligoflexia bacterium]|nr:hypothetical protein [Oligoflexia bacterium]